MKLKFSNMIRHFLLINRHKWAVFKNCVRCGIVFRGIVHDLSKFSPQEFIESARFFQGNRSPIGVCRRACGVSYAWLHHKGRNKHHLEYWLDNDCEVTPMMPYKYAVECVCDKLAATKTYAGGSYTNDMPLRHWYRYGNRVSGNPRTMMFLEKVFLDVYEHGERYVLSKKYMKRTFSEICLAEQMPAPLPVFSQMYDEERAKYDKIMAERRK
ncbi:MAG: catalase [Clostridia bacterium]|nr:catalase [Clostridia bacterium]